MKTGSDDMTNDEREYLDKNFMEMNLLDCVVLFVKYDPDSEQVLYGDSEDSVSLYTDYPTRTVRFILPDYESETALVGIVHDYFLRKVLPAYREHIRLNKK